MNVKKNKQIEEWKNTQTDRSTGRLMNVQADGWMFTKMDRWNNKLEDY
jgi:hypothetical protein